MLTDATIEDARKEGHKLLLEFLVREAPQCDAASVAHSIHSAVCAFERIHRHVTIRPDDLRWQKLSNPMAVKESLERLAKQSDYVRAKAFKELPPIAMDVLAVAAQKVTGEPLAKMMERWPFYPRGDVMMHIPKWTDMMLLLPTALELCSRDGTSRATRKVERDAAVVAVLRAYNAVYGDRPSVQKARPLIERVEKCYAALLQAKGFGVVRSAKTLQALINASV